MAKTLRDNSKKTNAPKSRRRRWTKKYLAQLEEIFLKETRPSRESPLQLEIEYKVEVVTPFKGPQHAKRLYSLACFFINHG